VSGDASLYERPALYGRLFPGPFEGELELLRALLPAPPARVLSLGCGAARVERHLAREGWRVTGIDAAPAMIAAAREADPAGDYRVARIEDLPGDGDLFDGAISLLLSLAYLSPAQLESSLPRLRARLRPGAPVVLDVPVARRPHRLQGVAERLEDGGQEYEFLYDEAVERGPWGARLETRLRVAALRERAQRSAVLTVLRPGAWRVLARRSGFAPPRFHPPHEPAGARLPPAEARRAIIELRAA
jgi:SAM-dependent methyltransferase